MDAKRYRPSIGTDHHGLCDVLEMREDSAGQYVSYADYCKLRAALADMAGEVRELVEAAIPALAELRNYRDDCEDYEAPENVPELEATIANLDAALAKHTHQEKP